MCAMPSSWIPVMRSFQNVCTVVAVFLASLTLALPNGTGSAMAQTPTPSNESARKLKIVFFGAHCDDNELGAGGLMRMLADQGHEVISAYATAFRRGRMIDGKSEDEVRRAESAAACKILGATPYFFRYAHEELEKPFADKKTLDEILDWFDETKPDIVVALWPVDTHPNHQVAGMSALMAYNQSGRIWGVEVSKAPKPKKSWNLYFYEVNTFTKRDDIETLAFSPNAYLDIGKVRDRKRKAIDCLKSQDPVTGWAVHDAMHAERGKQCGVRFAEAFHLIEAKPGCPLLPVPILSVKP
jgi:N-acetylglucosamine malate deacetylase 1